MAKDRAAKDAKRLTEEELLAALLWLFTETDHRQHIEAYRKSKEKPHPPAADAAVIEE